MPDTARVDTHDAVRARIEAIGPERIAAVIAEPVIGTGDVHGTGSSPPRRPRARNHALTVAL